MGLVLSISPNESAIFAALRSALLAILPVGVEVIKGQGNRVSPPAVPNYLVMWPLLNKRLATNLDQYLDAVFTGSIVGSLMTITAVNPNFTGVISVGSPIFGVGVVDGTVVTQLGTGTGGIGTYQVSPSQTVNSETLAAGIETVMQDFEMDVQVDVHGPLANDYAQMVTTVLRDSKGVDLLHASNKYVTPLHADDPVQSPFIDEEQQYENCYHVTVRLEIAQTLTFGLEFASELELSAVIDVDVVYPPQGD